jgi:predicted N-acetyltransferase YhbS
MSSDISIRIATLADIPAIAAIVNAAFEVETFLDGVRTDEKNIVDMMEKGEFLLMEDAAGQMLASVFVEARGERGYSGMFAVESSHQSMGLGRAMAGVAEDYLRSHGCKFIDIKVLSLRTKLLPFYHNLGYVETGTEEFWASRPVKDGMECHFILMSKPLLHPAS